MGLRLVASLSTQLAARVELERSHGTSVLFHFPAHADTGTRTADAANRA